MPDLGKYAFEVSAAYVVSLTLIAAIILLSVYRGRRVKVALAAAEGRVRCDD